MTLHSAYSKYEKYFLFPRQKSTAGLEKKLIRCGFHFFFKMKKKIIICCNHYFFKKHLSYWFERLVIVGGNKHLSKCFSNDQPLGCQSIIFVRPNQTLFVWNYLHIKFKNARKSTVFFFLFTSLTWPLKERFDCTHR